MLEIYLFFVGDFKMRWPVANLPLDSNPLSQTLHIIQVKMQRYIQGVYYPHLSMTLRLKSF